MLCKPLDAPLSSLHPDTPVFVVRYGLVYVYPADLLLDIANDRYVPVDPCIRILLHDLWEDASPFAAWVMGAERGMTRHYDIWRGSADADADAVRLSSAAKYAAEHLMNFETFRHRHLPDGGYHRASTTG